MTDPLLISQSEFAKSIGVTRQAVSKAVQEGRIQLFLDHTDGKMKLNKDLASKQWRESTLPRVENAKIQNVFRPQIALPPTDNKPPVSLDDVFDSEDATDLIQAKTKTEVLKGKILDLELKEKTGTLINAEKARLEAFKIGRILRDAIIVNVTNQLCNELAAESDPFIVHQKLTAALTKVLDGFVSEARSKYEEIITKELEDQNGAN